MTLLCESVSPAEARRRILAGDAPGGMRVNGRLDLKDTRLAELPPHLQVATLDLSGCKRLARLPQGLRVRHLILKGCTALTALRAGLSCYQLDLTASGIETLPADLRVEFRLDLTDCRFLRALPAGLKVGSLVLSGCTALAAFPEGLDVYFLDIQGCTQLTGWPARATIRIGRLNARGCTRLAALPRSLGQLSQLDVSDCPGLRTLPPDLRVTSWLDVGHTGITSLPASLAGVPLRWRGVPVDERIAFHPESITVEEVLGERNAERRRVLLDRFGYERFMTAADAEVLDTDHDAGGERRLLRVRLEGDEPLVCVAVCCPSTGRQYLLRVPPGMKTCRQAVAWTAGFSDPEDYRPVAET
jgi:hypothetical protein